jgi:hypothetical protein
MGKKRRVRRFGAKTVEEDLGQRAYRWWMHGFDPGRALPAEEDRSGTLGGGPGGPVDQEQLIFEAIDGVQDDLGHFVALAKFVEQAVSSSRSVTAVERGGSLRKIDNDR